MADVGSRGKMNALAAPTHVANSNEMMAALKKLREKVRGEFSRFPRDRIQESRTRSSSTGGKEVVPNESRDAGSPGRALREGPSPPSPPVPDIREPILEPDVARDSFSRERRADKTLKSRDPSPGLNAEFREKNSLCGIEVRSERITEGEKHQLEIFFKGLKTEIYVCECPVSLYAGSKDGNNWTHRHTGLIVVILDCGRTRSRIKRKIHILLAERGTCFPLWRDTIDNLSAYQRTSRSFHSMHLSTDHRQVVGLSFDSPSEADKLLAHIERLTSNPENINIFVPGSGKKARNIAGKGVAVLPPKKHISNPCLFEHVNNVSARDRVLYASLRTLTGLSEDREDASHGRPPKSGPAYSGTVQE